MSIKTAGKNATQIQNKYIAEKYDRINLLVPKGDKDAIKDYAAQRGESVLSYINRLISEDMARGGEQHDND